MPSVLTIDGVPLPDMSRRSFAAALPLAAFAGPLPATMAPAAGDARLVDLGERWKALAVQRDAYFEIEQGLAADDPQRAAFDTLEAQLYEQQATIEEAIFDAPATGTAGLAVKARPLARLNDGRGLDAAAIESAVQGRRYFEERCALSLAPDIVRLAEKARLT